MLPETLRADVEAPPATNRGVHWTVGGIDWIQATLRESEPANLCREINPTYEWAHLRGLNGYSDSFLVPGVRVLFTPQREDVHIICSGAWLTAGGTKLQRAILGFLNAKGASFTRIDLQLTDERPVATPRHVWQALERGEGVTRVKVWDWMERGGIQSGSSVYIGSKSSLQRLLVYDKSAESAEAVPGVRWELRGRDEAAETLALQLTASEEWGEVWAGRVLSFVDFREVGEATNSARRRRVAWFEELVAGAAKMRAYPERPMRTLEDVRHWLRRQVAPSLATVVLAAGGDTAPLLDLVTDGSHRLRALHRAMAAADERE